MRVLFATTRGAGHFGPLAPFGHACARAGHDVLVAGPWSVAALAARAGLPFRAVGEAPREVLDAAFAPVWSRSASVEHVIRDLFAGLHARTALPGMLAAVEQWRPDVIVRETMEFASAVAADRLGVPQVRVGIHLDARSSTWRPGRSTCRPSGCSRGRCSRARRATTPAPTASAPTRSRPAGPSSYTSPSARRRPRPSTSRASTGAPSTRSPTSRSPC